MENYFQAEAFNLDKVLDEFEQNEGPSPRLLSYILQETQLHSTNQNDQGCLDEFHRNISEKWKSWVWIPTYGQESKRANLAVLFGWEGHPPCTPVDHSDPNQSWTPTIHMYVEEGG